MEHIDKWLEDARSRGARLSEAYRLQLGRLWWANLALVVIPAVCSTVAAIVAAIPEDKLSGLFGGWILPPASILAGASAILIAVHKALKCEEYQAECLRLAQRYQGIAEMAGAALARSTNERAAIQERIAAELTELTVGVKARIPTSIMAKAKHRSEKLKLL